MAKTKKKEEPQQWPGGEEEDYVRRAIAAWFRGGASDQPGSYPASSVENHGGIFYVVLRNVNGVMAVYRIRRQGILKRLKRWPLEVEGTLEAIRERESRPRRKGGDR